MGFCVESFPHVYWCIRTDSFLLIKSIDATNGIQLLLIVIHISYHALQLSKDQLYTIHCVPALDSYFGNNCAQASDMRPPIINKHLHLIDETMYPRFAAIASFFRPQI